MYAAELMRALDENDSVEIWRLDELVRAGLPHPLAARIAIDRSINLHDAVELVKQVVASGRDPAIAFEILV